MLPVDSCPNERFERSVGVEGAVLEALCPRAGFERGIGSRFAKPKLLKESISEDMTSEFGPPDFLDFLRERLELDEGAERRFDSGTDNAGESCVGRGGTDGLVAMLLVSLLRDLAR